MSEQKLLHRCDESVSAAESSIKRGIDVMTASLLVLILTPLLLVIALAILVESPGPVVFKQRRTGLHGRTFRIWKFRTMSVMEDGAEMRHASKEDDRVTRIGALLRKTHWDELPQLFNILRGEMALIGPRPHAVAHDRLYSASFPQYYARFQVRPGLTGLAQVDGFRGEVLNNDCMRQRIEADLRYVKEWSLMLDLMIAVRTLPLLVIDEKAY